jgi:hypothetical protein
LGFEVDLLRTWLTFDGECRMAVGNALGDRDKSA